MNSVELIGRLTRDPDIRRNTQNTVVTFTLAVDRHDKDNNADFPRVTCFGQTADYVAQYVKQGRLVAVQGRIQTGSYTNKKGDTVYTTDVVAFRVEGLPEGNHQQYQQGQQVQQPQYQQQYATPAPNQYPTQAPQPPQYQQQQYVPPNFEEIDEDVPY